MWNGFKQIHWFTLSMGNFLGGYIISHSSHHFHFDCVVIVYGNWWVVAMASNLKMGTWTILFSLLLLFSTCGLPIWKCFGIYGCSSGLDFSHHGFKIGSFNDVVEYIWFEFTLVYFLHLTYRYQIDCPYSLICDYLVITFWRFLK